MKQLSNRWLLVVILLTGLLSACENNIDQHVTTVTDTFESGSIGQVEQISDNEWELSIADDNDNADLPDEWRCWWYVKMENINTETTTKITVNNSGWPYYYVPVYSYNQTEWIHFTEEEVTQDADSDIIIQKQFEQPTVWIARFYPYTYSDLESYINTLKSNPYIDIQTPGYTQKDRAIYLFKITDSSTPASGKKRIFMHARTHSAEIPSSFLIEGMVNFLLSGSSDALAILSHYEFYIFPMQNVDGVIAGNYRSTPKSENLEVMWYYNSENPLDLTTAAPPEVTTIQQYAKNLMSDGGPTIAIALNLHASNSEPDVKPFFYPHFGTESLGYSTTEASLWNQQTSFINTLMEQYGTNMLEPVPDEGGRSFASKTYPESWWWVNFSDKVMAMTFEMTYGRSGYAPRWVEPDDYRNLGASFILSIRDYCDGNNTTTRCNNKSAKADRYRQLKYPGLYPPDDPDEMKE